MKFRSYVSIPVICATLGVLLAGCGDNQDPVGARESNNSPHGDDFVLSFTFP
mgnify:CR=1 FL=1